jgi:hypothetical protein
VPSRRTAWRSSPGASRRSWRSWSRPAPGGIPAREGLNAHESLIAADSSYMTPQTEFGQWPKPKFLAEALEAGQRKQLAERAAIKERKKENR